MQYRTVFLRVLLPTASFWYPAYRAPAMLLAVSSYRPYGYPVRRISGRLPEPVLGGRFAGQKNIVLNPYGFPLPSLILLPISFLFTYKNILLYIYIVCIYIYYYI